MPRKYNYYHVDAGYFPAQVKLCFDDAEFQKILLDHDVNFRANALDTGIAETHYLSDGKDGIIILAINLNESNKDAAYLAGVIAHEATHIVCRIFDHIGETPEEIGEESRAYLTEHIVRQITQAVIMELKKIDGKTNRAASSKTGKRKKGDVPEVDIHRDGGAGQAGVSKSKSLLGRTKNN